MLSKVPKFYSKEVLFLNNQYKLEHKRALAKARYEKYMSIPGNREKRLSYYKEYYRKRKEALLGDGIYES